MRFAILSDIHGNIFALKECFKYIDELDVDSIIWCGDYITDIPRSHDVIQFMKDAMQKYKSYIIRGNREDYIIDYHNSNKTAWTMENRNGPFLCCYNELDLEDIKFISSLPTCCTIDLPNVPKIFVSHKEDDNGGADCTYRVFGHSHQRQLFQKQNIKHINPGSVGLTVSGSKGAEFAILEITPSYHKVETYQVQYDMDSAIQAIKQSDLSKIELNWSDILIKDIQTGQDYTILYIQEVRKIAKECGFESDLDRIPMEIWHQAEYILNLNET